MKKILIVDDNAGQRDLFKGFMEKNNFSVITATSGEDAIKKMETEIIDMIISDIRMSGMNGLDLLKIVSEQKPEIPVLLITAYANVKDAINAVRIGAADYLEKPVDLRQMLDCVRNKLKLGIPEKTHENLPNLPENMIAESTEIKNILNDIALVAPTDASILLSGESGTGKEVLADLIFQWSNRKDKKFIKINCAAISETLLESELFGYEKGAFTGANERKIGIFEEADNGTIFLDEIGETSPKLQAKLLRITQDGSFSRVGSAHEQKVNVRIISATNLDLEDEISKGNFREDLYYRLNVFEILLPPLREHAKDILPLANFFGNKFSKEKIRFSSQAINCLENYHWQGNIRELRNVIERATLLARGDIILPEHLPVKIAALKENNNTNIENTMQNIERSAILKALEEHHYNRSETANVLKISRRSLIYKLNQYKAEGFKINKSL